MTSLPRFITLTAEKSDDFAAATKLAIPVSSIVRLEVAEVGGKTGTLVLMDRNVRPLCSAFFTLEIIDVIVNRINTLE